MNGKIRICRRVEENGGLLLGMDMDRVLEQGVVYEIEFIQGECVIRRLGPCSREKTWTHNVGDIIGMGLAADVLMTKEENT